MQREDERERVGRQGSEAWGRLKHDKNWNDWLQVGEALQVGREWAMSQAQVNKPEGKGYNMAFSEWLQRFKLDDMDKGDRHRLFQVMDDLPMIEQWRQTLSLTARLKLNHPTSVMRKFKAATIEPEKAKKPKKPGPPESVVELSEENQPLKEHVAELEMTINEKLPPYSAKDQQERQEMIEWVCQKLLEDEAKLLTPLKNPLSPDYSKKWAIQEAWYGNIEPLRKTYPELAPFLCPPKKRQQKKDLPRDDDKDLPRDDDKDLPRKHDIEWVASDVRRIRDLWQKYHNKKRRNKTDGASAYEIAVIYFERHPMAAKGQDPPTLDEVEARLKPSGPSGEKRRKK